MSRRLKEALDKRIISNGDYFEDDNINVDNLIFIFKKRKFPLIFVRTSYTK